ncbi:hypothetical protein ACP4OV_024015 [Aristida adscensionis]
MTSDDELVVARQLVRLDVDIIEAGFPASSPDDLDIVLSIAIEVGNAPVGKDAHVPSSAASCAVTSRTSTPPGRPCATSAIPGYTPSSPPARSTCSTS